MATQMGKGLHVNTRRAYHSVSASTYSAGLQPSQQLEDHLLQATSNLIILVLVVLLKILVYVYSKRVLFLKSK